MNQQITLKLSKTDQSFLLALLALARDTAFTNGNCALGYSAAELIQRVKVAG